MTIWIAGGIVAALFLFALYDILQKNHTILRNFPVIGHFRYWFEAVGPELRQYIVTGNDEERPFSRDQRRWVYATAKDENAYFGFGSDNDMDRTSNYVIIQPVPFPLSGGPAADLPNHPLPVAKVLGGARNRKKAFRPKSVVNVSAMSFGSLSGAAVRAINEGCRIAECLHNTGEGGISIHHNHGGDLVWQIGTGYFGCRDSNGGFSKEQFVDQIASHPTVRAVEIKLSQGAKPGIGGILPGVKVTKDIAAARGVPVGTDCISPAKHTAFHDADSLLDFVEDLAETTGLPVGIKSAVGNLTLWHELAANMASGERGIDFITIDGGEGGTGAAPLVFSDHVALPFRIAFSRVYKIFAEQNITDRIVFNGSGKLGFPENALVAFALGCDMVSLAREALLAIGCIQSQKCHTGQCPTGITTHNRWLVRGLDPTLKSVRLAHYLTTLRKEIIRLSHAMGMAHPSLVTASEIEILDSDMKSTPLAEIFGYGNNSKSVDANTLSAIDELMKSGS